MLFLNVVGGVEDLFVNAGLESMALHLKDAIQYF
jgi:hypothetical protein